MSVDVVDLREFYSGALGEAASASISMEISKLIDDTSNEHTIGIGYAVPILDRLKNLDALCFMPARQGALQWPSAGEAKTALVDELALPIANASVDLVILAHVLENSADPAEMLNEIWRILAPEGRVIVVVSNRRGPWARFEHTPFGQGRPFSRRQLRGLLRDARLSPFYWGHALHFPPTSSPRLLKFGARLEKLAKKIWPAFSGAIVVEARKRLYQGIPTGTKRKKVLVPVLAPQSFTRSNENQD